MFVSNELFMVCIVFSSANKHIFRTLLSEYLHLRMQRSTEMAQDTRFPIEDPLD